MQKLGVQKELGVFEQKEKNGEAQRGDGKPGTRPQGLVGPRGAWFYPEGQKGPCPILNSH